MFNVSEIKAKRVWLRLKVGLDDKGREGWLKVDFCNYQIYLLRGFGAGWRKKSRELSVTGIAVIKQLQIFVKMSCDSVC